MTHGIYFIPSPTSGDDAYLTHIGSNLAGIADSPIGTMSFWYRSVELDYPGSVTFGGFGDFYPLLGEPSGSPAHSALNVFLLRGSSQPLVLIAFGAAGDQEFSADAPMLCSLCDARWHHILLNWDVGHPLNSRIANIIVDRHHCYQVPLSWRNSGATAFTIPYSTFGDWEVGGGTPGHLAELWFQPGLFLDVTDPTVQAKFITSSSTPADLGTNGQAVTGTAPILYLSQRGTDYHEFFVNRGTGGGTFVIGGSSPTGGGFALSDRDPVLENPIKTVTIPTTDLTMSSTSYPSLNLGWDRSSNAIFADSGIGGQIVLGVGGMTVFNPPPQYADDLVTPVQANFATLADDGATTTMSQLSGSAGSDSYNTGFARGASHVYCVAYDTTVDDGEIYVSIMTLTPTISINGPIHLTRPAWVVEQFAQYRRIYAVATIVQWAGREQCVVCFSSYGGNAPGHALMVDSAGNVTDAKIWDGVNPFEGQELTDGLQFVAIVTLPHAGTANNYFLVTTAVQSGVDVPMRLVEADGSGNNLSTWVLHADNFADDVYLQMGFASTGATLDYHDYIWVQNINTGPLGFYFNGTKGYAQPTYITRLDPATVTFERFRLIPAEGDAVANTLLTMDFATTSAYFTADHRYVVFANDPANTGVLWDGASPPPAAKWCITSRFDSPAEGGIGDLWMTNSYVDFADPLVRAKFINSDGTWIDYGFTGQLPTGTSPLVWLTVQPGSPADDFLHNYGTGQSWLLLSSGETYPTDLEFDLCPTSPSIFEMADLKIVNRDLDEPRVFLRYSDTGGASWGNKLPEPLGKEGEFATNCQWQRLGTGRFKVFEISWSTPCLTALTGIFVDISVAQS